MARPLGNLAIVACRDEAINRAATHSAAMGAEVEGMVRGAGDGVQHIFSLQA